MSDSATHTSSYGATRPTEAPAPAAPARARLGDVLREAREAKGLELSDVAERTNVRKEYLKALDEGRYDDLPEDVFAKNFLRLYAQTVGLDEGRAIQLYNGERRGAEAAAATVKTSSLAAGKNAGKAAKSAASATKAAAQATQRVRSEPPSYGPSSAGRASQRVAGAVMSLVFVGLLVGGALWAYNSFFFVPTAASSPAGTAGSANAAGSTGAGTTSASPNAGGAAAASGAAGSTAAAAPVRDTVFLSVTSEPLGAEVSIDNYPLPGSTPVTGVPVTPADSRILRVTLEGYEPFERPIDLTFDRNLSVALTPIAALDVATTLQEPTAAATPAQAAAPADAGTGTAIPAPAAGGGVSLVVESASWLEVYSGTARGQGQTLLYRTVRPGESYSFDLPVFVHVGNAGGLRYSVAGQDRGLLGSQGQVVSRALTE